MGDKGKKDKDKRIEQNKGKSTLKEKQQQKKEKMESNRLNEINDVK